MFRIVDRLDARHVRFICLLFGLWANLAVSAQEPSAMPRSANAEYQLTESQIADLAARANQGDTKAAMRLAFYYDFVAGDHDSADKWLRKAADDGDPKAQFNLGVRTLGKGGSEVTSPRKLCPTFGVQFKQRKAFYSPTPDTYCAPTRFGVRAAPCASGIGLLVSTSSTVVAAVLPFGSRYWTPPM